ncbi:hypothetical protein SLEP1_g56347 [Rubroshorea leprosula]|uniref:Reverse transcriptase domain-containing protein n=1 Tax=Rubroshorea leprosula TaxID=152421 RepID=A0AAV5MI76_9ROSI|nr:hypothetical protein SLEP1_g56347 [Rubroshorea leprosula]
MWRAFSGYGRVIDIYVPNRKDRYGRRFRFARFQEVKNVSMLEKELDHIKVGGVKIHVNQPRIKMNRLGIAQATAPGQLRNHTGKYMNANHREKGKREWVAKSKDYEWRGESWSLGSVEATGSVQGEIKRFSSFSETGDEEDNYVAPWHEWVKEGKKESLSHDVWPTQTLNEALENSIPKGRISNISWKIMKEMSYGYRRMEMTAASFEKSNDVGRINEEEETRKNYSRSKETTVEKIGTNLKMDQTSNRTMDQGEIGLGADGPGKKHKVNAEVAQNKEKAIMHSNRNENQSSSSNIGPMMMKNKKLGNNTSEVDSLRSFFQDMDNDLGTVQDWMRGKEKPQRSKKSKRAKSCAAVYKAAKLIRIEARKGRRTRGRSREKQSKDMSMPKFLPDVNHAIVDELIDDNNINNCNKAILKCKKDFGARESWEFAQSIGVETQRNEESILRRLEQLEERGIGCGWKWREIRKLVGKEKVEFLMLQEIKIGNVDRGICREMWSTKNFEWVAKNAKGSAGGLLCLWNREIFVLDKSLQEPILLGIYGFWGTERVPCYIINVYSPCGNNGKRDLSCNLSNIANNSVTAMCVGGDFNVTISQEERKGCRGNRKEMEGFKDFIAEIGLIDLPMIGRSFTWSILDYCPVLLKNEMKNWGPKPFRFFNAWLGHPEFKEKWSIEHFSELDKTIKECREVISKLDVKGEAHTLTEEKLELKKKSEVDLWQKLQAKDYMLRQKTTTQWLKFGDANSKFFHQCIKDLKEGVAEYFKALFTEEEWERPRLEGIDFKKVTPEQNAMLVSQFTKKEIKEAVWDCDNYNAPGPDGFNFGFLKAMWETVKNDVISFVDDFQKNRKLVRGSNASFIILIPKKENLVRVKDYRPISLIGCMYKIIAKLLANRIKKVMEGLISEQQSTFIHGRQLMDSVIVANKIIDEIQKKKKSPIFKIDFEKAY